MAAPENYTELGLVGYTYKGAYRSTATYNKFNTAYYNGSTFVCIKDNTINQTPENDGVYWALMAEGYDETLFNELRDMIYHNKFYAPISTDDTEKYELMDDDGTFILADWRFKEA